MSNPRLHTPGLESAADFTLIRKAIKEKWPIPAALRRKAVKLLTKSMDNPEVDPIQAIRTLVEMDKVNAKYEAIHTPKEHLHVHQLSDQQIQERLEKLEREKNIVSIQDARDIEPGQLPEQGPYLL